MARRFLAPLPEGGTDLPVLLSPAESRARASSNIGWTLQPVHGAALVLALALFVFVPDAVAQDAGEGREPILAVMLRWTPVLGEGFAFNLLISFMSMAIGTLAGVFLGLMQVSPLRPLRVVSYWVTQFFRNAPWLVLLFYCIFLIPFEIEILGLEIPFPGWVKAVIGLSLPVMANVSEIVRGAVQSIPDGQWEAAESLAFSRRQTMWMIILPQCIKRMIPPWMNWYAILTMATPLVSIVGVSDAMQRTGEILAAENRQDLLIPMYLYLLGWFFLYCYPIARWTIRLERRFAVVT